MKGKLERVPQRIGVSWRYRKLREASKSYGWHCHHEYEIAIHRNFIGRCSVGNYASDVDHNHMVLIGPGLPHTIYADALIDAHDLCETHVIWFQKSWVEGLIAQCPELSALNELLANAQQGLQFSPQTGEQVCTLLADVLELPPARQLARLIETLCLMLEDEETIRLINPMVTHSGKAQRRTNSNIEKIETYLMAHFGENISLNDLAEHLFLSESSIRRLFTDHFNESFTQRLKKIRLNVACDMLAHTDVPVNVIRDKVGYTNQANFNRQFKAYKRVSPSEYRSAMKRYR
ncbi:helix-turn-helix transcriptional regulator [Vibrio furnissii]|uniref:helix-turn-helix transcriptional regulator n=1 Tax=Vibrio furnissii TaxID=29494 RepID=UPI001EEB5DA2|nr:AraC family transcriptional regulator [Vibrio furnissii]MCG6268114.1 AraC family transcriptional regulator [Vibrio furnissii]